MAHKKAGGSTSLGRDSAGKRLGLKIHSGQLAKAGNIIVRQRGTKFIAGGNVRKGKDDTLYAAVTGHVQFAKKRLTKYDGRIKKRGIVSIIPQK